MPLDPQNVPISFGQGIDTKTDSKQVLPGKLTLLKNASFQTLKEIRKRDGFEEITNEILGGGNITSGIGVESFKKELVILDGKELYSYSPDLDKQIDRGLMVPVDLSVSTVIRNSFSQSKPDSAYHPASGLKCFKWEESSWSGALACSIVDSDSGAIVAQHIPVDVTSTGHGSVLAIGDYFVLLYINGSGDLVYRAIDVSSPQTLGPEVSVATDISDEIFDTTVINGSIYIAYKVGTTQVGLYSLSPSLVLSSQYLVTTGQEVSNALTLVGDDSFNVWVIYSTSSALYGFIVNSSLSSLILANTLISSGINPYGYPCYNATAVVIGTEATIFLEQMETSSAYIVRCGLSLSGSVQGQEDFILRLGLASKAFVYNGEAYVLAIYAGDLRLTTSTGLAKQTSLEPTLFLLNQSAKPVLKLCPYLAMIGYFKNTTLPSVSQISESEFMTSYLIQDDDQLDVSNGNASAGTGMMEADFNFKTVHPLSSLEDGNNLHLASGQLWMYDGATIAEHGFHLYPENLDYNPVFVSGGIGPSVNYNSSGPNQIQYVAVYRWIDNQGQTHRSAPSNVLTVQLPKKDAITEKTFTGTVSALSNIITSVSSFTGLYVGQVLYDKTNASVFPDGTYITGLSYGTNTITVSQPASSAHAGDTFGTVDTLGIEITIPCLTVTEKDAVAIEIYRTVNNGTIFYRTTETAAMSNASFRSVTYVDTISDNYLIGNLQLYTTGGEVPNFAAPAVSAVIPFRNRAIYLSPESEFSWGYSKEIIGGVPVEFSSLLFSESVDQRIGRLTAGGQLDDKLILFGPKSKYYVTGQGPSPSGANNDFSPATRIAGVSGCENQASVLELPIGLVYQDKEKGIWLLDRSLSEKYIGAEVEQYKAQTITSACLIPDSTKAVFTLSNGINLTYDYYVNQWETDVYPEPAFDTTTFENKIVYIQSDGKTLLQTPSEFSDDGSLIPIEIETGWMNLAQITGFQRVWELHITGEYKSPHTLTVYTYTNFSDSPSQVTVINVPKDPKPYEFRITMKQQKCTSIRYRLVESQPVDVAGEGFSLSALGIRVGVKKGLNKLRAGVSY